MSPRVSIIIVTYGQRALTEQCLRSLESALGDRLGTEFELVLVDNNSPDDTPDLLRAWADRAVVKLLSRNRNFAGGCNDGAAVARGEVLLFLNNDTEVAPGALEKVADQALEPGVSVAGCRLLFPDGTLQHAGVMFLHGSALGGAAMGQHIFHRQSPELPASQGIYELDCVTGACMAVRAATFRAVNGFDESFVNGLEDVDLCLRVRMAGERIVYRGDVTIIHHEGASRGQGKDLWATPERIAVMQHNDHLFTGRWAQMLDQDDEPAARLWDAGLEDRAPDRFEYNADVVVAGQPDGIGPGGDEARALIAALTAVGRRPAAANEPRPLVVPRLTGALAAVMDPARRRLPLPDAPWVLVPAGERDRVAVSCPSVLRLGRDRTASPISATTTVWASSPQLRDRLAGAGLRADRIRVVAPPVLPAPIGPGGHGVLAVLPAHAPATARAIIAALRQLPPSTTVRLVPTVVTRGLERGLAGALPGAELLAPISDEGRFAALAADADVVMVVGDGDPFERRALVAAAGGAAVITTSREGPAAAILGAEAVAHADALGAGLLSRLDTSSVGREQRAARVAERCNPEHVADALMTHSSEVLRAAA